MGSGHKCTRQAGNEYGHNNLKFASMGLKPEALQPLILTNYLYEFLRPCKINESQDQRSTTICFRALNHIYT